MSRARPVSEAMSDQQSDQSHQVLHSLDIAYDWFIKITNMVAISLVFLITVYVTVDSVGNYIFHAPAPGVVGVLRVALPFIVFLAIAYTQRYGGHVRAGVVMSYLPFRGRAAVNVLANLLGIILFTLIARYGSKLAWDAWTQGEFIDGVLRVPTYPGRFAVVVGSISIAIQFAIDLVRSTITMIQGGERR